MFLLSPYYVLLFAGIASAICWIPVVIDWIAVPSGRHRQFLIPPSLLALAAFVPTAVALILTSRTTFVGSDTTSLNTILISLYVLGVGAMAIMVPRLGTQSPLNGVILGIILLYWMVGIIANYLAGLPLGRLSLFLIPVLLAAAWMWRPRYVDALSVVAFVTIVACGISLVFAAVDPSEAFTEPVRSATFLFPDRLAGIFEHPNALGLFAGIGFVISWQSKNWVRYLGGPICGIALIGSDSRTAWFGVAAAFCILLAGRTKDSRRARSFTTFRGLLAGSLVVLAALGISRYLVPEGQTDGFTGRTSIWHFVLEHWGESPLIGHGSSVWTHLIAAGRVPIYAGQAHDQFFQTLFTVGAVGVVLLAVLLWVWTVKSMRAARAGYWLPLAFEALIIAYSMFESPLSLEGIGADIWLLSIILFLDPIDDCQTALEVV